MKPIQYQQLYDLLLERGRRLINSPEQYRHCHQFAGDEADNIPFWYEGFAEQASLKRPGTSVSYV